MDNLSIPELLSLAALAVAVIAAFAQVAVVSHKNQRLLLVCLLIATTTLCFFLYFRERRKEGSKEKDRGNWELAIQEAKRQLLEEQKRKEEVEAASRRILEQAKRQLLEEQKRKEEAEAASRRILEPILFEGQQATEEQLRANRIAELRRRIVGSWREVERDGKPVDEAAVMTFNQDGSIKINKTNFLEFLCSEPRYEVIDSQTLSISCVHWLRGRRSYEIVPFFDGPNHVSWLEPMMFEQVKLRLDRVK